MPPYLRVAELRHRNAAEQRLYEAGQLMVQAREMAGMRGYPPSPATRPLATPEAACMYSVFLLLGFKNMPGTLNV